MKISRRSTALARAALALDHRASSRSRWRRAQDRPESILPPGFGDPVAAPQPAPAPQRRARRRIPPRRAGAPLPPIEPLPRRTPTPDASATATPTADRPRGAIRAARLCAPSLDRVGAVGAATAGCRRTRSGGADGRFLERLMRRLDAPVAVALAVDRAAPRAGVARSTRRRGVNGADFAAERAWLLLRMGEADAARAVVQSVDVDNYTPKLFQVAMQATLATGDPAGMCPLVEPARGVIERAPAGRWRGRCAPALAGKPARGGRAIDAARRGAGRRAAIDAAAGREGRRRGRAGAPRGDDRVGRGRPAVRMALGLATATGVEVPGRVARARRAAGALLACAVADDRAGARAPRRRSAAAQGVLSNLALVDLYGEIEDATTIRQRGGRDRARPARGLHRRRRRPTRLRR